MATTVPIEDADLPQLLQRARAGEEIILAEGETPVVRLVPAAPPRESLEHIEEMRTRRARAFGMFAGQVRIGPEFFEPLPEEELRLWEGRGDEE